MCRHLCASVCVLLTFTNMQAVSSLKVKCETLKSATQDRDSTRGMVGNA